MLADVIEIIMLGLVLVLRVVALRIPSIFALTYQATVLILYTVVASEGWVAASAGKTSTQLRLPTRRYPSHLEHAFIARVKLITQHWFDIVFQRHSKLTIFQP